MNIKGLMQDYKLTEDEAWSMVLSNPDYFMAQFFAAVAVMEITRYVGSIILEAIWDD